MAFMLTSWQQHSRQLHEALGGSALCGEDLVTAVALVVPLAGGLATSQSILAKAGPATNQTTPAKAGPATSQATPVKAATYYWSRCGNTSGWVLLTLDDWADGDPYRATRVGEYLKSRHIRAVFFLINREAQKYPDIIATLRQQGHWVLDHTYSHPRLTELSDADVSWQIRNGVISNRLRPPYGAFDSRIDSIAGSLGYRICTWTIDSLDFEYVNGSRRSTSSIRSIVRRSPRSAKASGVILGHLNTNFPNAISGIISDLDKQGLQFCRNRGPVGLTMPFPASCT
jgi:peptidoglycan/xylan/chitin deacetylase (PgdA/CDA1 family)